MKNKYLYIQTFGCQMNVHDSDQMATLLANIGYNKTDNKKIADLILLNTCSIREKAAQKVFSELGRLVKLKEENPAGIVKAKFGYALAQEHCRPGSRARPCAGSRTKVTIAEFRIRFLANRCWFADRSRCGSGPLVSRCTMPNPPGA